MFRYYEHKLAHFFTSHNGHAPQFRRIFVDSIFPAATFNFGPRVITVEHYDTQNKANGWIAVTALGHFDATKGGHIILRDFGVIVEFPAGSTILFPSSIIRHGNIPIRHGETRMSFTQYAAGNLFQWVDAGYRLENEICRKEYIELQHRKVTAWQDQLQLYSYYHELKQDLASNM